MTNLSTNNFSLGDLVFGGNGSGVSGGRLKTVDRNGFLDITHLKVKARQESPMLLKGYVGSIYKGNQWDDLDKNIYKDNMKVFSDLESYGITPETLIPILHSYGTNPQTLAPFVDDAHSITISTVDMDRMMGIMWLFDEEYQHISVENIRANSEFEYVPYDMISLHSDDNNIEYYSEEGVYEITDDLQVIESIFNYTQFVYDNYLQMPSDGLEQIKRDFPPMDDIDDATFKIRNYLENYAKYDLSPGNQPSDKDYIEYFLYENHKGYCSHFATAATMMFRAMGIPARYVEGYTVTYHDIVFNQDADGVIMINDSNAHAWTEVYDIMWGWIPIEVTPGASEISIPNWVSGSSNVDKDQVSSKVESEVVSSQESEEEKIPVSSDVESDLSTELDQDSKQEAVPKVGIVFLLFFGVVTVIILIIVFKNMIVVSKRKSRLNHQNINQSVIYGYEYVVELLAFIGLEKQVGETELEFSKRTTTECEFVEETFIDITQYALKAKFSSHEMNKLEREQISCFCANLSKDIYGSLNSAKKFKYIFIDNLDLKL